MRVAVVVGNPRPGSRTLAAALSLATTVDASTPEPVVDLVELGPALLVPGDPAVADSVRKVSAAQVAIVACPTYKGSFTGLLKLYLDLVPAGGLAGVVAVPLMLGASERHALAPEVGLKPVLVELGATCPTKSLFVLDACHDDQRIFDEWAASGRAQIRAALGMVAE